MKWERVHIFITMLGCALLIACGGSGSDDSDTVVVTSTDNGVQQDPGLDSGAGDPNKDTGPTTAEIEFDPHWLPVGVFTNASECGSCHKAATDNSGMMRLPQVADGDDISPYPLWRHSMMAQAWTDPYFQAVLEDQSAEFPAYAGDIQDKCLSCHSPMAHSYAHDTGLGLTTAACPLGGECYSFETSEQEHHAREGISCTLCHQMVENNESTPGSGNYTVPPDGDPDAWRIYGPVSTPLQQPMLVNTPYTPMHADYISSSEHCASCHELDTPAFDIDTGHPAEPPLSFREQATYSEWLNSAYADEGRQGRSCQNCHMPSPNDYETAIAVMRSGVANPNWPQRTPFAQHWGAGGNTYVLKLLRAWREELGIAQSTTTEGFDTAIARGREMLTQAAELTVLATEPKSGQLDLAVRIINNSGHKLPSGYPSRRAWLQLTVSDPSGKIVFESGKPDSEGYLALDYQHTDPGCLNTDSDQEFDPTACFEPHRDVINDASQVAIFETVMADTNGQLTYSLLHGAGYLKDNRLPPRGFTTAGANYDPASATLGFALTDPDFNKESGVEGSGSDTVHYQISLDGTPLGDVATERLTAEVRLWYQSIHPAFMAGMTHQGEKIDRMRAMYRSQPPEPELIAVQKKTIYR